MFEYYNCPKQTCLPLTRVICQPGYYYKTKDNYYRCAKCETGYICSGGLSSNAVQSTCKPGDTPNSTSTYCKTPAIRITSRPSTQAPSD